ncbi:XRE family transcriptional regulator [Staphylococcus felis]|nr:helix-turn-helix transcriptional regulator [Staphylococcus felis]REH87156.1 XRE family transcriptional regulator [Staphylococcus felis]
MAEHNYSIQYVHTETGLSRTTISNLYNGYSDGIKFDTLGKLCDLFKCTPNDLLLLTNIQVLETHYKLNISNEEEMKHGFDYACFCYINFSLDGKLMSLAIPFRIFYMPVSPDFPDISTAHIYLEDHNNEDISRSLGLNGIISKDLNNFFEKHILSNFGDSDLGKRILDMPPEIEYSFD